MRCSAAGGSQHDIVIRPGWAVEVPHDLAAERVLVALGGRSPCADFVDRVLPAGRAWLDLQLRTVLPRISPMRAGTPDPLGKCCKFPVSHGLHASYAPLRDVVAHIRSPWHLASIAEVYEPSLTRLTEALASAYGYESDFALDPDEAARVVDCVTPAESLDYLWSIGIAPHVVGQIHRQIAETSAPLPTERYINLLTGCGPDAAAILRALETTVPGSGAAGGVAGPPRGAGPWAPIRLGWPAVARLTRAGYDAGDVRTLSGGKRISLHAAARCLVRWAKAGCRPEVATLLRLHEIGLGDADERVSAVGVDRLAASLLEAGIEVERTTAGLMLVTAGSTPEALAWARKGVTDPLEIARRIADGASPAAETDSACR